MSYSSIDEKLDAEMNEHISTQLREMMMAGGQLPDEEDMERLLQQQLVQRGPSRARITAIEDDDDEQDELENADVDEEDEDEEEERTFVQNLWYQWRESGAEAYAKKGYQHASRYALKAKVFAFSSAWWLTTTTIVVGVPLWYAVTNQFQVGDMIRMESELANMKAQAPGRGGMGAPVGAPGTIPPLGTTAGSGIPLA